MTNIHHFTLSLISFTLVLSHSWVERLYVLENARTIGNPGYPHSNGESCFRYPIVNS
jgi:hypothetical protein